MGEGRLCQQFKGFIILHIMAAQYAAVSVGCILTHAHIREQIHFRELFSGLPKRPLHNTILCVCLASHLVLLIRDTKEHDFIHSCLHKPFQGVRQSVYAVSELSFHGGDFLLHILSLADKNGVNQGTLIHPGFPHHSAQGIVFPKPSRSDCHFHAATLLLSSLIVIFNYSYIRNTPDRSGDSFVPCFHSYLLFFKFTTKSTTLSMVACFAINVFIPYASAAAFVCFPIQAAVTFV